jgi:xanthine dehydrogenase YagS FAD-binding subunit
MVKNFSYLKAASLAEAIKALSAKGARLHAGGTDLLGCLRDEIIPVDKVVSISGLKDLKGWSMRADGGLKIGALTPLADVSHVAMLQSDVLRIRQYAVLSQAAASVGTPQIREQGTIGGNLCQRPRCWYFRSDLKCFKKGGAMCYAMNGENQYHVIFGGGPCFAVHPSDVAVALVALQAQFTISGPAGNKSVKAENFFVGPDQSIDKENILMPGQILTGIQIPPLTGNVRSVYRKVRTRGSWDFAQTSVAAVFQFEDKTVRAARIVLGGVAPHPWRAAAAEKAATGKKLDAATVAAIADAAVIGASPMSGNEYKVEMVRGTVEEVVGAFV